MKYPEMDFEEALIVMSKEELLETLIEARDLIKNGDTSYVCVAFQRAARNRVKGMVLEYISLSSIAPYTLLNEWLRYRGFLTDGYDEAGNHRMTQHRIHWLNQQILKVHKEIVDEESSRSLKGRILRIINRFTNKRNPYKVT